MRRSKWCPLKQASMRSRISSWNMLLLDRVSDTGSSIVRTVIMVLLFETAAKLLPSYSKRDRYAVQDGACRDQWGCRPLLLLLGVSPSMLTLTSGSIVEALQEPHRAYTSLKDIGKTLSSWPSITSCSIPPNRWRWPEHACTPAR